jgi:hypothetical protein
MSKREMDVVKSEQTKGLILERKMIIMIIMMMTKTVMICSFVFRLLNVFKNENKET